MLSEDKGIGVPHPEHHCFVFPRTLVDKIDMGDLLCGYPPVGCVLRAQLENLSETRDLDTSLVVYFNNASSVWQSDNFVTPELEFNLQESYLLMRRKFGFIVFRMNVIGVLL